MSGGIRWVPAHIAEWDEVCPICMRPWCLLDGDHSALLDYRSAFTGVERWVCQGTVGAEEYKALDEHRDFG